MSLCGEGHDAVLDTDAGKDISERTVDIAINESRRIAFSHNKPGLFCVKIATIVLHWFCDSFAHILYFILITKRLLSHHGPRSQPCRSTRMVPPATPGGLYAGDDGALGALNMMTPEVIAAAAASQIRSGALVSLDWPLIKPYFPSFGRMAFQDKIESRLHPTAETEDQRVVTDDALIFNTQCSSQWDGFRHYVNPS
jgi:hypothetical protein